MLKTFKKVLKLGSHKDKMQHSVFKKKQSDVIEFI